MKMKKKIVAASLAMAISVLTFSSLSMVTADVEWPLSIRINNEEVDFPDAQPFVDGNARTQVPVRFISEALLATVEWIPETSQVSIKKDDKAIMLTVGVMEMTVNGEAKTLDSAPLIQDSRTFVPLRFVSEALDAFVEWESETNTVFITVDDGTGEIDISESSSGRQTIPIGETTLHGIQMNVVAEDEAYVERGFKKVFKKSGASFIEEKDGGFNIAIYSNDNIANIAVAREEVRTFLTQVIEEQNVNKVMGLIDQYRKINENSYNEEIIDAAGIIYFTAAQSGFVEIRIFDEWSEVEDEG